MTIISMSLNDKILKDMDSLQKELGFSGRSEVIRTALRLLLASEKEKSKLIGIIEGVIIVINAEDNNDEITKIRHKFNDIIKTQIHNHLESHKCLQIFVIKGDAQKTKKLVNEIQTSRKAEYVKLFVS